MNFLPFFVVGRNGPRTSGPILAKGSSITDTGCKRARSYIVETPHANKQQPPCTCRWVRHARICSMCLDGWMRCTHGWVGRTLMHAWVARVHPSTCTDGWGVLKRRSFMWACVGGMRAGGAVNLSLQPGPAKATDQHWAVDQGLGTPVIENIIAEKNLIFRAPTIMNQKKGTP